MGMTETVFSFIPAYIKFKVLSMNDDDSVLY